MEATEEDEKDYTCGWFWFKPNWLQSFRTSVWALIFISFGAFLQCAVVNGLLHFMIPQIEQRFNLHSFDSGLVSGGYDIASLIFLIPITYIGGRPNSSKPLFLGIGVFIMGIGSLIFASPHFLSYTPYKVFKDNIFSNLCVGNETYYDCPKGHSQLSSFMWLLLIGNLLHGIGASPLYTLGITYIDDAVVKKKTGLYMGKCIYFLVKFNDEIVLGFYYAIATLGVAVGYISGGYFITLNENLLPEDSWNGRQTIQDSNSRSWIGAWWLGFIIFGILAMIVAIPITALPARLPDWEIVRISKNSEAIISEDRTKSYTKLNELPSALGELSKNTSFIFLSFAGCCEGVIFSGSGAFIPKIIQNQFLLSYKTTALIMGIITVPSAILGTLVGGGILKKFDLRFVGILKLCCGTATLSMLCTTCFLLNCAADNMVGLNTPYYADRTEISLQDPCNEACGCSEKQFMPICGVNNYTYYSPCYAGCTTVVSTIDYVTKYSNCSCIEESLPNKVQATSQPCKVSCPLLPVFLILMYLSLFFTFVAAMPALTATLRCVRADQTSLALGMQWLLVRLLGMIPGPMLFGLILDGTCEQWFSPCDAKEGSCILYDHYLISRSIVMLTYGWKLLEIILFGLSIYFYKKDRVQ